MAIDPATFPAPAPPMDSWFVHLSLPLVLPLTPATMGEAQLAIDASTFAPPVVPPVVPPIIVAPGGGGPALGPGFRRPEDLRDKKKRDVDIAIAVGVWLVFME